MSSFEALGNVGMGLVFNVVSVSPRVDTGRVRLVRHFIDMAKASVQPATQCVGCTKRAVT